MYRLQVKTHFDAAHQLKDYRGKCSRLHGHRWDVEVCLQGKKLDKLNMLVDFGEVKSKVNQLLDDLCDHEYLNKTLCEDNPTAEFLSKWLFDELNSRFDSVLSNVRLVRVCVWESPDCCIKYSPDMKSVSEE